ncbi:MAG TPA: alpha/beta fold hydrolase [Trebonia sp.]|nr:alpha/beta fold hydrolase [Trebonia sp.]
MPALPPPRHARTRGPARALFVTGLGAAIAAVLALISLGGPAGASSALPVNWDFTAGAAATALTPDTPPPGADNWSCQPTAAHPYPVILVNGTFANMDDNWQAASPLLANHGYCVFAFNYGGASPSDPIQGTGEIGASAAQLAAFVSRVLAATGASKVDLVGHSQGGMMPRYYINFLGGAATVNTLVGLAPSNYGTTIDGITTLASLLGAGSLINAGLSASCEACVEQEQGSAFLAHLNATPTVPGVRYTVIESNGDEVVTPYTNAFLPAAPNVTNILVNAQCPLDRSDHLEIAADPVALADMLNALDPASPVTVPCLPVLPLTGPVGPVPSF